MHVPPRLNLKFNVTTTDITIFSRCFHVITSVWGKSRFEQPPIYLCMGLRDEGVDCQGYFGQRPLFGACVCLCVIWFAVLLLALTFSLLSSCHRDEYGLSQHLSLLSFLLVQTSIANVTFLNANVAFSVSTLAPSSRRHVPLGMRFSQSFFQMSTPLILYVEDITV